MRLSHLILLIVMNFLWAASLAMYKVLSNYLAPGSIVTLRFGVAALSLIFFWPWMPGKTPSGRELLKTILMGLVVFTLGHRVQIYGTKMGTAGAYAAVLMAVEPILTSVAAAIFLREHIGIRRWLGFGLGMLGVALLNGFLLGGFQWTGLLASLIFVSSFLCESFYSIMGKVLIERSGMMKILTLALIFGTHGKSAAGRSRHARRKCASMPSALVVDDPLPLGNRLPRLVTPSGLWSSRKPTSISLP